MSEIKNDTNELEANVMKLKASMKKVARSIEQAKTAGDIQKCEVDELL